MKLPGVKKVSINYRTAKAIIYSEQSMDMRKVDVAILKAGYETGTDDSKLWISKDPKEYKDLIISFIILLVLYLIGKKFGLFNINAGTTNNPSNLLVVLMIGLTAGLSTCMALIGGLVLGVSARYSDRHPKATPIQKFRPHLFFNLGRILSYFLLGGIIGLVGKVFQFSGLTLGMLTIVVGVLMLIMGIQLTELFPRLSNGSLALPANVSGFLDIKKYDNKEYSHINSMMVGALTFFLPCGFTQAMQLYAMSTGSFLSGALVMSTFAVGTAPGLLSIGGLTSILRGALAKKIFKFTGILVVALAIFNIGNGWNLTGWRNIFTAKSTPIIVENDLDVKLENGVQVAKMTQSSSGYKPNEFTIKKGIPVKWMIDARDLNSCSASIFAPGINIKKILSAGLNVIEFTPDNIGEIKFTCAMGMYPGKFIVIPNLKEVGR